MTNLERFVDSFFNAKVAAEFWPLLLQGIGVTIVVAIAVIVCGLALGLGLALMRAQRVRGLNPLIAAFADIFRALPPLVVILILYFAVPSLGVPVTAFVATWLALTLVLGAFAEEIFWAGIIAVPRGQVEAGRATGLSRLQTLWHVVLPQAVRITVAPLTNRAIAITKNTALGSAVALAEILGQASSAASLALNPTPYTMGAAAYLAIFLPIVIFSRWLETRFAWKR